MNGVDRFIRAMRVKRAVRFIPPGARVLDVGCHDGELFRRLGPGLREGVGLDPGLVGPLAGERYRLSPGSFPADAPDEPASFDAITMLAVLEHVPRPEQPALMEAVRRLLRPKGRLVLTVPSPAVDRLLDVMTTAGVLDGLEADQHYGFHPDEVLPLAGGAGLQLLKRATFQARLNNLFVFERP